MKHSERCFSVRTQMRVLALLAGLALLPSLFAGGLVTNLTQVNLEAALAGGGTVLFATNGTIILTNTLVIEQDTVLDANAHAITLSGGNAVRLFQVDTNVTLTVNGLTLADGRLIGASGADGDPPAPGEDVAGASFLVCGGTLNLAGCVITNHVVWGGTAGRDLIQVANNLALGGRGLGAAVCVIGGRLNVTNSQFVGNQAIGGQGSPPSSSDPSYFGPAGAAQGGAIYLSHGTAVFEGAELKQNSVIGGAPQVTFSWSGAGGLGSGGGLYATNALVYLRGSTLTANCATGGFPLVFAQSGYGSGDGLGGAVYLALNTTGRVDLCSFLSNSAVGGRANYYDPAGSGRGGAVYNIGECHLSDSAFANNRADAAGGQRGARVGQGGAVYSSGTLVVNRCTLNGNVAQGGAGHSGLFGYPGGDAEGGALWSSGFLAVTNSTWASNQAAGGEAGLQVMYPVAAGGSARGGALFAGSGTATLVNVTVAYNRADAATNWNDYIKGQSLGGGLSSGGGTIAVRNSIIAYSQTGGDVYNSVNDGGCNLCSDSSTSFTAPGSFNNIDPLLGNLANNGGPTATMMLLAGSPARDTVPEGFPATDQRGIARPQWNAGDIGAVEATDESPPSIFVQPLSAVVPPGASTNFTVRASGPLLVYQWHHNNLGVAGATRATLDIPSATAGAQGDYFVVVSNLAGVTTSMVATLTFDATALTILRQPGSATTSAGHSVSFSVLVSGIPDIRYQWQRDGAPLAGATTSGLTLSAVSTNESGAYNVRVSNDYKSLLSATAQLAVWPDAVPPLLTCSQAESNLTITFNAESSRSYRLLGSTDLSTWIPIATNSSFSDGPLQFLRPTAEPKFYYRVVTP